MCPARPGERGPTRTTVPGRYRACAEWSVPAPVARRVGMPMARNRPAKSATCAPASGAAGRARALLSAAGCSSGRWIRACARAPPGPRSPAGCRSPDPNDRRPAVRPAAAARSGRWRGRHPYASVGRGVAPADLGGSCVPCPAGPTSPVSLLERRCSGLHSVVEMFVTLRVWTRPPTGRRPGRSQLSRHSGETGPWPLPRS